MKERVATSNHVHQSILFFGKMLQCGWGIQADEQVRTHSTGFKIRIELQNQSITVKGWIRVLTAVIHAVKAEVTDDLRQGPQGWILDRFDLGVCRHHSDKFQNTLVMPSMSRRSFEKHSCLIQVSGTFWSCVKPLILQLTLLQGSMDMIAVEPCYNHYRWREILFQACFLLKMKC